MLEFVEAAVLASAVGSVFSIISALWAKHGHKFKSQNEARILQAEELLHELSLQIKDLKDRDNEEVSRNLGLILKNIQLTKDTIANERNRQI